MSWRLGVRTVRLRSARLLRESARADRVRLRYHSRALPAGSPMPPPASTPSSSWSWTSRPIGVAPGQTACLLDGERVVGTRDDRLTRQPASVD